MWINWMIECVIGGRKCNYCGNRFTYQQWKDAHKDPARWDGGHVRCPEYQDGKGT